MKNKEWGEGPWDYEPDWDHWMTAGLNCCLIRHRGFGTWCGYVGLPPGHAAFGRGYYDDLLTNVEVHGGLTFADEHLRAVGHCGDDTKGFWWLGFDCGHAWDVAPYHHDHHLADPTAHYRDYDFAKAECTALAGQLSVLAPNATSKEIPCNPNTDRP